MNEILKSPKGIYNDLEIPSLSRKYGLMCLLGKLNRIERRQVEMLADNIYGITTVHPLADTWINIEGGSRHLRSDPFLSSVALYYEREEMEKTWEEISPTFHKITKATQLPSLEDTLAGSGKPRPLLKELYSLYSTGLVKRALVGPLEFFSLTLRGKAHAEALEIIFEDLQKRLAKRNCVVIDKTGKTTIMPISPLN